MIYNQDLYIATHWNFEMLTGVNPANPNIKWGSDLDRFYERNGFVLYIETKSPNVPVPKGQQIAFDSFVRNGDSVLIVWGKPEKPIRLELTTPEYHHIYENANNDVLWEVIRQWFIHANKYKKIVTVTKKPI